MVNVHIYPSPFTHESRILKEAQTLHSRLGLYPIALIGVATKGQPARERISDQIEIHRLGPSKGHGIMKAVRHLIWCMHVLWFCLRTRPRIVNSHSLPVLPIGVIAKWILGSKLVYDAHELETETNGTSGIRRIVGRILERFCLRFVDLLVVVSPGIETWYRETYGVDAIITVLNTPLYCETERTSLISENLGIDPQKKIALYQGVLGTGRGLEAIVAASEALDVAGYALVLMGYGPMQQELARLTQSRPFHLHPPVTPSELLSYTASADFGLCLVEDSCLSYRLSLPNKLFEYAMARIPVIASDLPEIRSVVEGSQIGACISDTSSNGIVRAICQVHSATDEGLYKRLDEVARHYCWEAQEEALVKAYSHYVLT